jgi:hypothetical protein
MFAREFMLFVGFVFFFLIVHVCLGVISPFFDYKKVLGGYFLLSFNVYRKFETIK